MKVSIIIPVYNVEKYLQRCIDSALAQTYLNTEIILVDDGSKDSSGKMCDEITKKDSRIKVIHKENGGLSSARNAGIELATGDALFFLDSDDYLSCDCISKCVAMLEENDADIANVQMMYIAEGTNEEIKSDVIEIKEVLNTSKAIEASLYQILYSCCAPAKLYKREVIGDIKFPIGRLSEDLATCHLFINNASKVAYSNSYGYYYRQHDNSIMHTFNPKRIDALEWAINIEEFCENNYPSITSAAVCRTFNIAIHLILDLPDSGEIHDKYFKQIWNEVKRTRLSTLKDKKVRGREKAAALLSFGGENMLKLIWNSELAVKRKEI